MSVLPLVIYHGTSALTAICRRLPASSTHFPGLLGSTLVRFRAAQRSNVVCSHHCNFFFALCVLQISVTSASNNVPKGRLQGGDPMQPHPAFH